MQIAVRRTERAASGQNEGVSQAEPVPWMDDQVFTLRPQSCTKPSESAWRKRSAAS
jgi:hypothetical protein